MVRLVYGWFDDTYRVIILNFKGVQRVTIVVINAPLIPSAARAQQSHTSNVATGGA